MKKKLTALLVMAAAMTMAFGITVMAAEAPGSLAGNLCKLQHNAGQLYVIELSPGGDNTKVKV